MSRAVDLRREAKKRRVSAAALRQAIAMLREQSREHRQREMLLRRAVWEVYAWTRGCFPFWRHGMKRRFPRAFSDGDRTLIPRFDELAQALAPEFPEFLGGNNAACGDDPSERLFDFLASDYVPLPTAGELVVEALAMLTLRRKRCRA